MSEVTPLEDRIGIAELAYAKAIEAVGLSTIHHLFDETSDPILLSVRDELKRRFVSEFRAGITQPLGRVIDA